jgi:DNA-directed RNA polymerase subunit RPC12/RpoP
MGVPINPDEMENKLEASDLPEMHLPSYKIHLGKCPKCGRLFKFASLDKEPIWEEMTCELCGEKIIPLEVNTKYSEFPETDFNPSKRES